MEKHIVKKIKTKLEAEGYWVMKIHGGPYQMAGLPDLLAIREGKSYWVEVKQPGKKATPLQERTLIKLRKYGCRAGVATNVEEAMEICESQSFLKE